MPNEHTFSTTGPLDAIICPPASNSTQTPAATLLPSQAIDGVLALIAALALCGVLGGISLLIPPYIDIDNYMSRD
jgi:hypothetical protein